MFAASLDRSEPGFRVAFCSADLIKSAEFDANDLFEIIRERDGENFAATIRVYQVSISWIVRDLIGRKDRVAEARCERDENLNVVREERIGGESKDMPLTTSPNWLVWSARRVVVSGLLSSSPPSPGISG